jgi:hypothetical protein
MACAGADSWLQRLGGERGAFPRDTQRAMSQENVEVIRLLTERVNAGDVEGQLEFIHPDIELFVPEDEPQ